MLNFVILGVQFQVRNYKPTKISTRVPRLSARCSDHEIKNHENFFWGPIVEVTKIASPKKLLPIRYPVYIGTSFLIISLAACSTQKKEV